MKFLKLALAGVTALWAGAAGAQQAACVIFEHDAFQGRSYAFSSSGVSSRYSRRWNDEVSSVRVARGCQMTAWEHPNFGGRSIVIDSDTGVLGRAWNDKISSSRCECGLPRGGRDGGRDQRGDRGRGGDGAAIGNGNPPRLRRNGLACNVFRDRNFQGPWRAFRDGEDDKRLGRRLNDEVSSVQVARGCVALLDIGRDYKLYFDHDVPNLGRAGNDRSDSVSCFCQ